MSFAAGSSIADSSSSADGCRTGFPGIVAPARIACLPERKLVRQYPVADKAECGARLAFAKITLPIFYIRPSVSRYRSSGSSVFIRSLQ